MKPSTQVWFKCESVGRPESTLKMQSTAREAILTIGQWLMGVYMGQKIRITIARTEEELANDRRSAANLDMLAELDSLLPKDDIERENRATICNDRGCGLSMHHIQGSPGCRFAEI
jgi:hypothetical protein